MKVLLVNDDGYWSEGTRILKELLLKQGYLVYLALPRDNCSGFGNKIHINNKIKFSIMGDQAIVVEGSPVDCFHVGVAYWKQREITFDIILSGVNDGMNIGASRRYSGTYAVASEGIQYGYPSIAISCHEKVYEEINVEQLEFIIPIIEKYMGWYSAEMRLGLNINIITKTELVSLCKEGDSVEFSNKLYRAEILDGYGEIRLNDNLPPIENRGNIIIGTIPYIPQEEDQLDIFIDCE